MLNPGDVISSVVSLLKKKGTIRFANSSSDQTQTLIIFILFKEIWLQLQLQLHNLGFQPARGESGSKYVQHGGNNPPIDCDCGQQEPTDDVSDFS